MIWLQSFFDTPARRALGWTTLGLLGILMAAGGIWFLTDDDGGPGQVAQADDSTLAAPPTATATATRTSTPTATASPSPSATATPSPAATARPALANPGAGGGAPADSGVEEAAPEPTATPTEPPVLAGGDYCVPSSSGPFTGPPNSVIGTFTIGGAPAPAGTSVSLAFDGVIGPTRTTTAAGGYRVDYNAAGEQCANRVGAAISVVHNGVFYSTGHTVGDSPGAPVNFSLAVP